MGPVGDSCGGKGEAKREVTRWMPVASRQLYHPLVKRCIRLLLDEVVYKNANAEGRVVHYESPEQLRNLLDLSLSETGETDEELLQRIETVVKYSVRTGHPFFINQLFSSVDPFGLLGQWVTDALNCSVYTYEVAPVFTLMETEVLNAICKLIGYSEGSGLFAPGGSISNLYGLLCSRFHAFPHTKEEGILQLPQMVIFTSEDAHYSIKKAAIIIGIGKQNVVCVATDAKGRMDVDSLEKAIVRCLDEGKHPLAVVATCGTTVLGAFDPLPPVSDVCRRYGVWLHVDAALGGGMMFSRRHRSMIQGIERSDSVTFNAHKMLAVPQQCSMFFTRHTSCLEQMLSLRASYLFQEDRMYDPCYDCGDKSMQCGRRCDVFKFWLMWQAKGYLGFEKHVNRLMDIVEEFVDHVRATPGFRLVIDPPPGINVCFWYLPPRLKNPEECLHCVAPIIKKRMVLCGSMMISYQPLRSLPNFFRFTAQNSSLTSSELQFFVQEIARLGEDIE